jgi:hypothetical protein
VDKRHRKQQQGLDCDHLGCAAGAAGADDAAAAGPFVVVEFVFYVRELESS